LRRLSCSNVYGGQPTKGGSAAIFFRVPKEDAAVGTVKVEVDFKPEYALGSVRTKPVPGWTAAVTTSKLAAPVKTASGTDVTQAVTKVIWTAQPGTKIVAGSTDPGICSQRRTAPEQRRRGRASRADPRGRQGRQLEFLVAQRLHPSFVSNADEAEIGVGVGWLPGWSVLDRQSCVVVGEFGGGGFRRHCSLEL
jgi:hypothetical protein